MPDRPLLSRPAAGLLAALSLLTLWRALESFSPVLAEPRAAAEPAGDPEYLSLGRNLWREGRYRVDGAVEKASAVRGPLYPSLISLVHAAGLDPAPRALARLQAGLAVLALPAVFAVGWGAHSLPAGLLAAGFYALSPEVTRAGSGVGVEFLYLLSLLGVAAAAVTWSLSPKPWAAGLLGLALGLSLSCRSPLALLAPGLALWVGWARARTDRGTRLKSAALLLLGSLLPLLPWLTRNALSLGRFIPFESAAAGEVIYGASLGHIDYRIESIRAEADAQVPGWRAPQRAQAFRTLQRQALRNILEAPGRYLGSCGLRLIESLRPLAGWLLLGFCGLLLSRPSPGQSLLLLILTYYVAVHALIAYQARYFIALAPVLHLWAGCGAASVLRGQAGSFADRARPARLCLAAAAAISGLLLLISLWGAASLLRERLQAPAWETAELHEQEARLPESEAAWSGLSAPSPRGCASLARRGRVRERLGRWEAARRDYENAAAACPRDPEPYLGLGSLAFVRGAAGESFAQYSRALARAQDLGIPFILSQALFGRSLAAYRLGGAREAQKAMASLAALGLDPLEPGVREGVRFVLGHPPGQWAAAGRQLGAAAFHLRRAVDRMRRGEAGPARRELDAGWAQAPGALCGAGLALLDLAQAPAPLLGYCAERHPQDAKLRSDLGVSLALAGNWPAAGREFRRALRLDPGLPQAHLNLAYLYSRRGDSARAREHLESARNSAQARGLMGMVQDARQALTKRH